VAIEAEMGTGELRQKRLDLVRIHGHADHCLPGRHRGLARPYGDGISAAIAFLRPQTGAVGLRIVDAQDEQRIGSRRSRIHDKASVTGVASVGKSVADRGMPQSSLARFLARFDVTSSRLSEPLSSEGGWKEEPDRSIHGSIVDCPPPARQR
jgi:hypothetical protein